MNYFIPTSHKKYDYYSKCPLCTLATIPDKTVGTRSKFSPPLTFNVDNQVISAIFVGKNAIHCIFQH